MDPYVHTTIVDSDYTTIVGFDCCVPPTLGTTWPTFDLDGWRSTKAPLHHRRALFFSFPPPVSPGFFSTSCMCCKVCIKIRRRPSAVQAIMCDFSRTKKPRKRFAFALYTGRYFGQNLEKYWNKKIAQFSFETNGLKYSFHTHLHSENIPRRPGPLLMVQGRPYRSNFCRFFPPPLFSSRFPKNLDLLIMPERWNVWKFDAFHFFSGAPVNTPNFVVLFSHLIGKTPQ